MKESIKKKFDSIDQSKIKVESTKELLGKIEKKLNSKTQENVDKAEALLDKFIAQAKAKNADIFVSSKPAPTLTATQKKKATQVVKNKLDALMDTIANDPLLKDFNNSRRVKGGGKSDPLIDSERKARESGRRVSKKGWKNQYGASNGGRRYYEYRENRIDRKAPNYGSRPWLEDGGMVHPSNSMHEKFMVVEIMEDGSRKVHNKFPDMESAMMFGALKRNFLKSGSQLIIEDENGKQVYRSFKNGGKLTEKDYEMAFAPRYLEAEDFERMSEMTEKKYRGNDKKLGVHDAFTKYWYNGGREKAMAKYGDDENEAWEESYEDFKEDFYKMAKGGKIDESTAMVLSQNKEIAHHTEELKKALKKNPEVEPWVIGKIERASTDMSDITHYLDGKTEYAKGGKIENQYEGRTSEDIWNNLSKEQREHFLYDHRRKIIGDEPIGDFYENKNKNWDDLNYEIQFSFQDHVKSGQYADGGYMADGGKIKGDTLENVRKDAKSLSRNLKEDMYLLEEKHYQFSNTNDKKIVTQYTVATQEDVDYLKEMPKNRLVVSFKILGKYSNGELKSSEQEVLFADGGYMADGGKVRWQDVFAGDNALVIAENKMGVVIKPYGRRFHLRFPDGSEKTYSAEELEFFKDEEFAKGGYTKRRDVKLIVIKNPNKKGTKDYLTIDKKYFLNGLNKFEEGGKLTKDYTYIKRSDVDQVAYYDEKGKTQIDFKPQNGFWVSKKALVDAGMNETKAKFDAKEVANEIIALSNKAWDTLSIESGSEIYASDSLQENLADEYYKLGIDKIYKKLTKPERKKVSDILTDENEHSLRNYLALRGFNGEAEYKNYAKMYEDTYAKFGYRSNWNPKNVDVSLGVVSGIYAKGGDIGFEKLANKVAKNYEGDKVKPKYQKEYGKTYDKAEAKEVGNKVAAKVYRQQLAKMEHGGKLPEDLGKYFIKTRSTKVIKMEDLIPLRARPTGIANAEKYMKMAYDGEMEKRKPITIYKSQRKYRVLDGNSTYAVAKANGWENIWAEVVKNPNMKNVVKRTDDIFSRAKSIRKEGESWQDALQRAKSMK